MSSSKRPQSIKSELKKIQSDISSYQRFLNTVNLSSQYKGKHFLEAPKKWYVALEDINADIREGRREPENILEVVSKITAIQDSIASVERLAIKKFENLQRNFEIAQSKLDELEKELGKVGDENKELRNEVEELKNLVSAIQGTKAPVDRQSMFTKSYNETTAEYKLEFPESKYQKISAALEIAFKKQALALYKAETDKIVEGINNAVEEKKTLVNIAKALKNSKLLPSGEYEITLGGATGIINKKQFDDIQDLANNKTIKKAETYKKKLLNIAKPTIQKNIIEVLNSLLATKNTEENRKLFGLAEFEEQLKGQNYLFQAFDINSHRFISNSSVSKFYINLIQNVDKLTKNGIHGIHTVDQLMSMIEGTQKYEYGRNYKYKEGFRLGEDYLTQRPVNQYRGYTDLLYPFNNSPEAQNIRGAIDGTCSKLFDVAVNLLFLNNGPEFKEGFKRMVYRAYYANVHKLDLRNLIVSKEKDGHVLVDAGVILGILIGTLKQLLESNALPEHYVTALALNRKVGANHVDWVMEQFTKGVAIVRNFDYFCSLEDGTDIFLDSSGKAYFVKPPKEYLSSNDPSSLIAEKLLPEVTAPLSNEPIDKKALAEGFSAVYLLFRGLFIRKDTPEKVRRLVELIQHKGTILDDNMTAFLDSDIPMVLGDIKDQDMERAFRALTEDGDSWHTLTSKYGYVTAAYYLNKRSTAPLYKELREPEQNSSDMEKQKSAVEEYKKGKKKGKKKGTGGPGDYGGPCCCCKQREKSIIPLLGDIKLALIDGVEKQLKISNIKLNAILRKRGIKISEVDKIESVSIPDNINSLGSANAESKRANNNVLKKSNKASYQAKQETKDRKRAEQKSFISLLIPELAKLMKKGPIWDIFKLLFLQLGAKHPKTAAALLLGGPALAFGGARFAGRALLGLPGWAGVGAQTVAKAGTFGGPIQNIKSGWQAFLGKNFAPKGGVARSIVSQIKKEEAHQALSDKLLHKKLEPYRQFEKTRENFIKASKRAKSMDRAMWRWSNPNDPGYYYNKPRVRPLTDAELKNTSIWKKGTWGSMESIQRAFRIKADTAKSEYLNAYKSLKGKGPLGVAEQEKRLLASKQFSRYSTTMGKSGGYIKSFGKGILEGSVNNAKFNWMKYSEQGAKGTFGTLKNAAKGAPGVGALLEVLFDIPDIYKAAISGKKGALAQQLSKTLGAVIGTLVGAFLGPLGWILGPIIGRSIGQGFGKHIGEIGDAFKRLGSAISRIVEVCEPLIKVSSEIIGLVGELFAGVLVQAIDMVTAFVNAVASAVHWIRYKTDKDYRKAYDSQTQDGGLSKRQQKYLDNVNTPGTKENKAIVAKARRALENEFGRLSYEKKTGTGQFINPQPKKSILDALTKAPSFNEQLAMRTQAQIDNDKKLEKEKKKRKEKYVNDRLDKKVAELMANESKYVAEKAKEDNERKIKSLGNVTSIDKHAITSDFGYRIHPIYKDRRFHSGVDLAYGLNEPVKAKHGGKVISVGNKNDGYGNVVVIQEDNGMIQRYAHLNDTLTLKYGSVVKKGETIGLAGQTGNSTGPHLHYEVMDKNKKFLNPTAYENGVLTYASVDKAGNIVTGGGTTTSTSNFTTPAQTNDGVRDSLLSLAGEVKKRHELDDANRLVFDPTDVTGSLGCWGVVGMNNTGVYK